MSRKQNSECVVCKSGFYARPNIKANGGGKYCSRECYLIATNKNIYPIVKKCIFCGKDIIITEKTYRNKKFCSSSCSATYSNSRRKGVKYKVRASIRDLAIKTYGHKCMIENCCYEKIIDAHHIVYSSQNGDNSFENIILLCPNHHREVHKKFISKQELKDTIKNWKRG